MPLVPALFPGLRPEKEPGSQLPTDYEQPQLFSG